MVPYNNDYYLLGIILRRNAGEGSKMTSLKALFQGLFSGVINTPGPNRFYQSISCDSLDLFL